MIKDVTFIKIDTETVDFEILLDLVNVIGLFEKKPLIEFEINYYCGPNILSGEEAQMIVDLYVQHGYERADIADLRSKGGDGMLVPTDLENQK